MTLRSPLRRPQGGVSGMPVLLSSLEELDKRVLSQPVKNVVRCKVTKGQEKSKVKVITSRRMYVVVIPTEKLEEVLNTIKEKTGCEDVTIYE